ncbi:MULTISPECIES: IS110 family transposase [Mesorhizobium]|uniref:IS110 family transposase n=1 Tax=Mesorhizobium sp. WSM3876 TaxID=422277 RepID=UPI001FE09C6B|nr:MULTISPECIES: IS110 family transposase [Mesorhizobium]
MGPSPALKLVGECGTDLRPWPTAKHFTSWLCLAPGNKISGGKVALLAHREIIKSSSRIVAVGGHDIGRSDTALGAFYVDCPFVRARRRPGRRPP